MKNKKSEKGMGLKDNTQASAVKSVPSNSEKYDLGRIKNYSAGTKGYPAKALKDSI